MRIKGIIVLLALTLGVISCRPKDEDDVPTPSYILPEDKFIDVLTDCYLGEGAAGINVLNVTGPKYDSAYRFNPFRDHQISRQQFDTTIVWYSQHPKKLKVLYGRLLENLSRMVAMGTMGKSQAVASNKYAGQDARFFFNESKVDSINHASDIAGYQARIPYRIN